MKEYKITASFWGCKLTHCVDAETPEEAVTKFRETDWTPIFIKVEESKLGDDTGTVLSFHL
jgi:hypothetical protein